MTNISTEHKNNVFCLLYQDKKYLLSLYNAVNGTDYQNLDELEVVTQYNINKGYNEVIEMRIYEFDTEAYERVLKEENWELGHGEGLAEYHAAEETD